MDDVEDVTASSGGLRVHIADVTSQRYRVLVYRDKSSDEVVAEYEVMADRVVVHHCLGVGVIALRGDHGQA